MIRTGSVGALVFVFAVAGPVFAQQPKQPPTTAEFQALAEQVAALTQRVNALQAGTVTTTDVVGTWLVVQRGLALHGGTSPRIGEEFGTATFTFRPDGTGVVTFVSAQTTLYTSSGLFEREAGTLADVPFTWVLTGNGVLMTFPDGGQLGAAVAAGGHALLASIASENGPNGSWSDIWQGIKLPPQP